MTNSGNRQNSRFVNIPPAPQIARDLGKIAFARKMISKRPADTTPTGAIPVVAIDPVDLEAQRATPAPHLYRLSHSTILIKFGAEYWIIDPVFSKRASPVPFAGPKRFHDMPIDLDNLPALQGVIISHNHYDHLDKATIKHLADKVPHFITATGVGKYLRKWGVPTEKITELNWHENHQINGLTITATPSQHFSGRGITDANTSLWASFCLRFKSTNIFFGSDSGYFNGFAKIGKKYGPFDLAMLECGAYDVAWPDMHMTPPQTLQAFKDINAKALMPIHNGSFCLAFHPWNEPLVQLAALAQNDGVPFLSPRMGERVILGDPVKSDRWWVDPA